MQLIFLLGLFSTNEDISVYKIINKSNLPFIFSRCAALCIIFFCLLALFIKRWTVVSVLIPLIENILVDYFSSKNNNRPPFIYIVGFGHSLLRQISFTLQRMKIRRCTLHLIPSLHRKFATFICHIKCKERVWRGGVFCESCLVRESWLRLLLLLPFCPLVFWGLCYTGSKSMEHYKLN